MWVVVVIASKKTKLRSEKQVLKRNKLFNEQWTLLRYSNIFYYGIYVLYIKDERREDESEGEEMLKLLHFADKEESHLVTLNELLSSFASRG